MGIVRTTIELEFPGGDGHGTNTWHLRTTETTPSGPPTSGLVSAAMDAIKTYYQTLAGQLWDSAYSAKWNGEALTVEDEPQNVDSSSPWTVTGTGTKQPVAAGVGLVVGWRTSLASRSGRGRTFHCPLPVGAYETDGTLGPGVLTGMLTNANTLVSASTAPAAWSIGVYSPTDGVIRDITGVRVADKVAYLSSRRD